MIEYVRLGITIVVLLATGFHFISALETRIAVVEAVLEEDVAQGKAFDGKVMDFLIHHKPENGGGK